MISNYNIACGFHESASRYPTHEALVAGAERFTYHDLQTAVQRLSATLAPNLTSGRVGILATRSSQACIGILATAWAGGTYVPISLKLPAGRMLELFDILDLDALIVDPAGQKLLTPELEARAPAAIFAPGDAPGEFKRLRETGTASSPAVSTAPAQVDGDHTAYIEFTSGTTGRPKGVMVSTSAVSAYLDAMHGWYDFGATDRAAETCDITFDLSVHNMLTTWKAGAALFIMRPLDMLAPARFINNNNITTWLSVPSVVAMARKAGGLSRGSMPSLRISLFCGEPLPVDAANAWQQAAPNSIVDNIYGPTEVTIACLRQTWTSNGRETESRGIVAIGHSYPSVKARIVDANLRPVQDGISGEIALAGTQLADGYFRQPELTAERFPLIDGERWYLTGDRGFRDAEGVFHHLGRLDNQIKLHGHRIELEEIDAGLREAANTDLAVAVAWPLNNGIAEGLVGFCSGSNRDALEISNRLRAILPPHMVPARIDQIDDMPLNANGKIDRNALTRRLEAEQLNLEVAS